MLKTQLNFQSLKRVFFVHLGRKQNSAQTHNPKEMPLQTFIVEIMPL